MPNVQLQAGRIYTIFARSFLTTKRVSCVTFLTKADDSPSAVLSLDFSKHHYGQMNTVGVFSDYELDRHNPVPSINHGSIQANLLFELVAYRKRCLNELLMKAGKYFDIACSRAGWCCRVLITFTVFSQKNNYQMSRFDQTLRDDLLGIEFPTKRRL